MALCSRRVCRCAAGHTDLAGLRCCCAPSCGSRTVAVRERQRCPPQVVGFRSDRHYRWLTPDGRSSGVFAWAPTLLFPNYGRRRTRRDYRIGMAKDDPPRTFLPPEYGRDPKCNRHQFVATTDLGSKPLDLEDVPQVRRCVLGDALKTGSLAVPEVGGGPVHGLGGLFPSLRRRAERIGDNEVIPSRV